MDTILMLSREVKEYMTSNVVIVTPDATLEEVKIIFDSHSFHHLPVVDYENKLKGLISKADLLLLMDWGTKYNLSSSKRKNTFMLKSNLASDLMEEKMVTVHPDDTIEKCLSIFKENYFHAIPVVGKDRELLGLITTFDLLVGAFSNPKNIVT